MKLLFLVSLIILVSGDESRRLVAERTADGNDVSSPVTTVLQAQPSVQEVIGEKKLGKRSYSLLSQVPYVRTNYSPVLPWYRLRSGLSSYGYGYPSWPLSYGGWQGGWYKGW
ncbi:uncharacterized protein LOC105430444 [Pogonomyrmex barbatus]|uniref:Uncharacterized protein LOC105430444 n=1 Tax=Pogonomyrmex barbatus TaxID=144034 RepID=A0A6I9WI05_9HYME|nr:uncharacterized protein LOC105430444 [Pogonomyrmex barbatus]